MRVLDQSGETHIDTTTWLAYERTRESYERTLQSWIRTGTSLITFGFSVYKFFQIETAGSAKEKYAIGPREFGTALVVLGLISLVLAVVDYRRQIRSLVARYPGGKKTSLAILIAALLSGLGIVALIFIVLRA